MGETGEDCPWWSGKATSLKTPDSCKVVFVMFENIGVCGKDAFLNLFLIR